MVQVAKLSEELREKFGEENERIKAESLAKEELFRQQEEKMLTQMKASHAHQKVAAEQVEELQGALKTAAETVKDCHKTNIALASEKKELLAINLSLRDEFTRSRARVSALEDQSKDKETQIKKLQTMKQRLESLCRFQQDKLKEHAAVQKPSTDAEPCKESDACKEVEHAAAQDAGASNAHSSTCAESVSEVACEDAVSEATP